MNDFSTNPLNSDTDGLSDYNEIETYGFSMLTLIVLQFYKKTKAK
ncbi:MAG TPA: hypothetical protein VMZ29_01180 [Candidatus Bathyarchaeia archaeon]|nr:hypothetical protein [Candidatus Bathyarchaeia archaeon]